MSTKLCFLVRRLPANSDKKLPKDVAVVSVSTSAKAAHYIFEQNHHSLHYHPEVNRQLLQIPTKHRHLMVTLTPEQLLKYQDPFADTFHFERRPLRLWKMTVGALTGN